MTPRYAVFYAPPPGDPLWEAGSSAIGYDAVSGAARPFPPDLPCPDTEWQALTAEPRRYGLHGTLKAPFHLADGATEDDLLDAARAFASARPAFDLPRLRVALVGSFVALVGSEPSPRLDDLAAGCVEAFEPFRAPLTAADRARRLGARLTERQARQLDRWGYPYVFEDFRFHVTLTGPVPDVLRDPVRTRLERLCGGIANGLRLDAVCIFRQDDRQGRFRVLARVPLHDAPRG